MKYRLKKDIVIKAGTIFDTAASKTERDPDVFAECVIGLTKHTAGTLCYEVGDSYDWENPNFRRAIGRWFERVTTA